MRKNEKKVPYQKVFLLKISILPNRKDEDINSC